VAFTSDDLAIKRNVPTLAVDTRDNFRFSQLVETAKDSFVEELRQFFAQPTVAAARFAEILTIGKYGISQQSTDPFENLVTLIREYPDILKKLPLISVTKAGGARKPIGLTGAFVDHVQYPPRVRATNPQPYNLSAILNITTPPTLAFRTKPDGVNYRTSTMVLPSFPFPTPAAVTAQQLADIINVQALYARARAVTTGGSTFLELVAGGPVRATKPIALPAATNPRNYRSSDHETPNRIEVTGGTATLLTALGFTVGQADDSDNPARRPANRYGTGASFTIGIDVGADSDNERTELTDLLIYFLSLYMSDRDFTFYGEHVYAEPVAGGATERYFQVILSDWSLAGEADIPLPDGEKEGKVYVNRFNVPITIYDYVDRTIPANLIPPNYQLRDHTYKANTQPLNILGVKIVALDGATLSGVGTLTYVAGAALTLQWQAPGALVPGAAVAVGAGGVFTLPGGDGSSIAVSVQAAGLPVNRASQPVNITGVRIDSVGATAPAGVGTLAYAIVGLARNMTWAPFGDVAGAIVNVAAGGTFVLTGGAGSTITVVVDPLDLPTTTPESDSITITTTYTDSITLNREEIPEPS